MICNPVIEAVIGCGDGGQALAILLARLFRIVMVVGGLALLLFFAWGGLSWITAGGDKDKVEQARNRITNAIVGMAVLVATIAVAIVLSWLFGFNLLNPNLSGLGGGSGGTNNGGGSTGGGTLPGVGLASCGCGGTSGGCAQDGQIGRLTFGGTCFECTPDRWVDLGHSNCAASISCYSCP